MKDDTIRRFDAIAEIRKARTPDVASHQYAELFINAVCRAPSADRPQGDFVSKRYLLAEIDDLADEFSEVDENGLHSERWCGISDAKCVIVNAPLVADRPQGEWIDAEIPLESGGSMPIQACNLCKTFYPLAYTGGGHRFCPNCGSRMKGADDERRYDQKV